MKRVLWMAACAVMVTGMANAATDLDLEILGDGAPSVAIPEGTASVDIEIYAQLVGDLDPPDGLALIGFDLSQTGGLTLAENWLTAGPSMGSFVKTAGLTNPAGYGGTLVAGVLLQIGGGQNTIGNTGAAPDYPIGTVVEDIGNSQVLVAEATLDTSSLLEGTYTLTLDNAFANVIDDFSAGSPYSVSPADGYTYTNQTLTIVVSAGGIPVDLVSAASWNTHFGTDFPIPLNITGVASVETRTQGVRELVFTMTGPPDSGGSVYLKGAVNPGPYAGTVSEVGNDLVVTFGAGVIPGVDRYAICASGTNYSFAMEIINQFGNVQQVPPPTQRTTDGFDVSAVGGVIGAGVVPTTSANAKYDVLQVPPPSRNTIDGFDKSAIGGAPSGPVSATAVTCP